MTVAPSILQAISKRKRWLPCCLKVSLSLLKRRGRYPIKHGDFGKKVAADRGHDIEFFGSSPDTS